MLDTTRPPKYCKWAPNGADVLCGCPSVSRTWPGKWRPLLSFWDVAASSGCGSEQLAAPSTRPMAHVERGTSRKPMNPPQDIAERMFSPRALETRSDPPDKIVRRTDEPDHRNDERTPSARGRGCTSPHCTSPPFPI